METLKKLVDRLFEKRPDEDAVDRANNSVTPFLLICCAIVVFAKEYGPASEPMYCWTQAEFNDQWMEYIHDFCFVESTYYVPFNESIAMVGQRNKGTDRLNYYQWVPFILVAMALFSQFTHYFWCFCNMLSEKDMPSILRKVNAAVYDADRETNIPDITEGIASHFHVALLANSDDAMMVAAMDTKKQRHFLGGVLARNCLAFVYLLTKFLYLVANIVQFKFISVFLGVDKLPSWGWKVLNSLLTHGSSWEHNGHFPRVTLCDLKIRQPDDRFLDFTVQCVLVANFLNEKIFMMLYFWFILMAFVSLISLIQWCWTLLFRSQNHFVNRLIELSLLQMFPDPEFNDQLTMVAQDGAAETGPENAGTERGGDELDSRPQRGHPIAVVSDSNTKTDDDHHSARGAPSNNSTATMEEMAQHSMELLLNSAPNHRADTGEKGNGSGGGSGGESMKWDDEALLIEAQKKRNKLYRHFRENKTKFMAFLGVDGIMAAKMMCASAGLRMSSLVMGHLFSAFHQHNNHLLLPVDGQPALAAAV